MHSHILLFQVPLELVSGSIALGLNVSYFFSANYCCYVFARSFRIYRNGPVGRRGTGFPVPERWM
jgi:hypothetical protein